MSENSDIIIIGGGIIGLCSAYYLNQNGHKVTLLEKGDVGGACSYGNAGFVCPSHFIPLAAPGIIAKGLKWMLSSTSPFYIRPRPSPALLTWLWEFRRHATKAHVENVRLLLRDLGLASLDLYREMAKTLKADLHENGLLHLFTSESARDEASQWVEISNEIGVTAELLDNAEINKREPTIETEAPLAIYFKQDSHLTPHEFNAALAEYLKKRGVDIHANSTVLQFKSYGNRIKAVTTAQGQFAADEFVLAAGSWSPRLLSKLNILLPVQAGKGYSISVSETDNALKIPLILHEARVAVTPMNGFVRYAGTLELSGIDSSVNRKRVKGLLDSIVDFLPRFEPDKYYDTEVWAGLRPCSPDGLPFIGRFKSCRNLVAATGHAMIGMSLGAVTGKLVADIIADEKPGIDIRRLNPDRYN